MTETLAKDAPTSASHSPARRRYTWKRALAFGVFLLALSATVYVGGMYYIVSMKPPSVIAQEGSAWEGGLKTMQTPGEVAFPSRDRLNILCLGVDYNYDNLAQHHTKFARSDTMFVLSIDKKGETLNIVSIPRDLRVDIPGVGTDKINAAFANKETGDLPLAKRTVETLLGVPIDHTVVIKEYAAIAIVNAVGGVTVNVEKDMDYDDNWGHLHIHLKKGTQRLSGEQAVGFVRFRHDEEGDRGRIRRQQVFLDSLLRELKRPSYTTYTEVAKIFKDNIQTDLTIPEMIDVANIYRKFDRKKMKTAKIDGADITVDGLSYIQADETEMRRIVSHMLVEHQGFFPDEVKVQVLNGSSVEGVARTFANVLVTRGYNVVDVDVAKKPVAETYIEDHRNLPEADRALQDMMGQTRIFDGRSKVNPKADITIVIGRDWATRVKPYETQSPSPQPSDAPIGGAARPLSAEPTTDVPARQVDAPQQPVVGAPVEIEPQPATQRPDALEEKPPSPTPEESTRNR